RSRVQPPAERSEQDPLGSCPRRFPRGHGPVRRQSLGYSSFPSFPSVQIVCPLWGRKSKTKRTPKFLQLSPRGVFHYRKLRENFHKNSSGDLPPVLNITKVPRVPRGSGD